MENIYKLSICDLDLNAYFRISWIGPVSVCSCLTLEFELKLIINGYFEPLYIYSEKFK
jgi:hypothetical protein